MQCDFCSSRNVVRRFPCRDFDSESKDVGVHFDTRVGPDTNLVLESKNFWAACSDCTKLVEAQDIEGLVNRALETFHPHPKIAEKLRVHLLWTYGLFFQNRLPEVRVN